MTTRQDLITLARHAQQATSLFVRDIGNGLLVVSHNTLALVGLAVVAVLLVFSSQAGLRQQLESSALGWLSARQEARAEAEGNTLLAQALAALGWIEGEEPRERRAFVLRDVQGRPVPACLWALRPSRTMRAFGERPLALLMLPTAGAAPEPDPQILSAGFDLTPAEGRLLAALTQCLDVQGAAQVLGISFHTARCHLRNIFDKTGVRTQKELLHQTQQLMALG